MTEVSEATRFFIINTQAFPCGDPQSPFPIGHYLVNSIVDQRIFACGIVIKALYSIAIQTVSSVSCPDPNKTFLILSNTTCVVAGQSLSFGNVIELNIWELL